MSLLTLYSPFSILLFAFLNSSLLLFFLSSVILKVNEHVVLTVDSESRAEAMVHHFPARIRLVIDSSGGGDERMYNDRGSLPECNGTNALEGKWVEETACEKVNEFLFPLFYLFYLFFLISLLSLFSFLLSPFFYLHSLPSFLDPPFSTLLSFLSSKFAINGNKEPLYETTPAGHICQHAIPVYAKVTKSSLPILLLSLSFHLSFFSRLPSPCPGFMQTERRVWSGNLFIATCAYFLSIR